MTGVLPLRMTLRGLLPIETLSRSVWLAILVIGVTLIALRFDEFVVGSTTDDAVYVELSRSLAEGRGPAIHLSECISYHLRQLFPLGYPVLLSGIAWIAPTSIDALKLLSVVATLSTILLLSRLLRPLAATVERRLLLALVLLTGRLCCLFAGGDPRLRDLAATRGDLLARDPRRTSGGIDCQRSDRRAGHGRCRAGRSRAEA
jgi:hypothetical protein